MSRKPFSVPARLRSFVYAFRGVIYMVKTQHNAWIHLFLGFWVIVFGFFFQISWQEWCWLILAIGFVLTAETFNTALEVLVDFVCPEFHQQAGLVKDLGSGAVLLAAIAAAITGLIIFLPKVWFWVSSLV